MLYENILVPVSFETDRDSTKAVEIAAALRAPEGSITMLHVAEQLPEYATAHLPEGFRAKRVKEMQDSLEALAADLSNAHIEIIEGHSGRTILEFAKAKGKDCIVIASHRPGMQDLLLGSTATHVVRHADCAVHVVR